MNPENLPKRVLEAYIGEYASGKSENAVNRALELAHLGRKVTLVDLDLVEPCYTLRPLKRKLEEEGYLCWPGIPGIDWPGGNRQYFKAGGPFLPAAPW